MLGHAEDAFPTDSSVIKGVKHFVVVNNVQYLAVVTGCSATKTPKNGKSRREEFRVKPTIRQTANGVDDRSTVSVIRRLELSSDDRWRHLSTVYGAHTMR